MCTVSFHAQRDGYLLGMNRDEKLTRAIGLPPAQREIADRIILCPSEPGDGTWICLNDAGVSFALINWYSVPACATQPAASRGKVVTAVAATELAQDATEAIHRQPLSAINPFRLIGVFPAQREIVEWRWNLAELSRHQFPWQAGAWFSSGHDEPGAQQARGKVFDDFLQQPDAGTTSWLRRFHSSHAPERSAYSTCMHRNDAATVSYTEIQLTADRGVMRYARKSPCCGQLSAPLSLQLKQQA